MWTLPTVVEKYNSAPSGPNAGGWLEDLDMIH